LIDIVFYIEKLIILFYWQLQLSLVWEIYSIKNKIIAQQQQYQQTILSVLHSAKSHQSHQIINFVNPNDNVSYKGTFTLISSKPIEIISYTETTINQTTNSTTKFWKIGNEKFIPRNPN
jgi:hypothetical protein